MFVDYFDNYRDLIVVRDNHRFVFVTRSGDPFTNSYWSENISKLLFHHTGNRVATNLLRSSFVTHFRDSEAAQDPVMRESVAAVMRHSVAEQSRTYDRRTSTQRKRKGLEFLAAMAEPVEGVESVESKKRHHSSTDSPLGARPTDVATVVEFRRQVFQVIRVQTDDNRVLLARMVRSAVSNAPVYYVPVGCMYEWQAKGECKEMVGVWNEDNEFCLV